MGRALVMLLAVLALGGPWGSPSLRAQGEGAGETVLFSAADPAGDDYGAGGLQYPTHQAFAPHRGLLDLRQFRVVRDGERIHFDVTFGHVTNPFSAPEGFYHQRVDVYIATGSGDGSTQPFYPGGSQVRFAARHPWQFYLRIAPFGGTRLHFYDDPPEAPGHGRGVETGLLGDGKTIRASVPLELLGTPERAWRYYVLVGGYDHFGPDEWRDVTQEATDWTFGATSHPSLTPRVVDMLAPAWGLRSQARQLRSGDGVAGWPPVVHPVGPGMARPIPVMALGAVVSAVGAAVWLRRRRAGPR